MTAIFNEITKFFQNDHFLCAVFESRDGSR